MRVTDDKIRVGVDIGGTFTDVALDHPGGMATAKVLTNYAEPEQAILDGIVKAADRAGVALGDIHQVIHGTTLVTNALIERRGAKLAFITTEGFRDVVEMRSENRFEQYDLNLELPKPLVPRKDRFTVNERMSAEGDVLLALDPADVAAVVARVLAGGYDAVAVGFLHAYANPAHEQAVEAALRAAAPELSISISSVISPQMREFERFNTVIANAYVQPQVATYLDRLVARLGAEGVGAPVFMMHSGGGLISVETASREPVRLLESGPAGGAIFAADFAKAHGLDKVLSFDMGGTTAKICLIEDGTPKTANTFEVARTYRFKKGSGMPVSTPVVEMVEIGAGGGSIAHVDSMGQIRVGPQSAASEPGPACYQRGGEEPTVSDSNLILGRLDPDNFAGGAIPLSPALSEQALVTRICDATGLDPRDAAFGVTEMVDENMANAARVHTVENGRDIEAFTMIAFGGGAPLHACRLCEKLGIETLIIPPGAGVGSAIGFLKAPFSYEASKGIFQRLDQFDPDTVNAALTALEDEARAFVRAGAGDAETTTRLTAYMRYSGQGYEIPVVLPYRTFTAEDGDTIGAAFEAAYRRLFGRVIDGLAVEITNWSLVVASVLPDVASAGRHLTGLPIDTARERRFYDAALREMVTAAEVDREALTPGAVVHGPAVVVERNTSTIVTSAYTVTGQGDGSLLLQRKAAAMREVAA
ncbi:MAG: hydantoinase/oxoprolinase family protein [Pseudomonadota bacterium]